MNAEAERYLRRATRGLWGRRRREVREELAAHLEERVTAYRIAGFSEVDATDRALTELGSPRVVSAGMARLYTLPTVMGSSLAAAVLGLSFLALWPKGLAQPAVIGSFYWPSPECTAALRTDSVLGAFRVCRELDTTLWLDPQALAKTLEAQGVRVRRNAKTLTLAFPGGAYVGVPTGGYTVMFSEGLTFDVTLDNFEVNGFEEIPAEPGSVSLWDLLESVGKQSDLSIRVEGDKNPVVHLGGISFRVGTELRSVDGAEFYDSYLTNVLLSSLFVPLGNEQSFSTYNPRVDFGAPLEETALELNAAPGTYGVITLLDPATLENSSLSDEAASSDIHVSLEVVQYDGGAFVANLPESSVRLVSAFSADSKPGEAVVVRLGSGENWYEVVSPEDVTLEARP